MTEDDQIYYSPYTLHSASGLNSASARRSFDGVLIRTKGGFGCIHPWPELGDPSLDKCLKDLRGKRRWPIVKRALRCAELDGKARQLEDWMFDEVELPKSHGTLVTLDTDNVTELHSAGFETFKLKVGRNLSHEADLLNGLAKQFDQCRWRLDFNENADVESVVRFIETLDEGARAAIDFLEDPVPYSPETWRRLRRKVGLNLAVDRESSVQSSVGQVMVIKPAIDEPWLLTEAAQRHGQGVVITSYMDHPLGQSFAAWEAVSMNASFPGAVGLCGLQTHGLFRPDAFTECLGAPQPEFQPARGTGLGFDDELEELVWKRLD